MENKNNTNLIEKKEESKKDEPSQKCETIKEAMDNGLSYEEALFGD